MALLNLNKYMYSGTINASVFQQHHKCLETILK